MWLVKNNGLSTEIIYVLAVVFSVIRENRRTHCQIFDDLLSMKDKTSISELEPNLDNPLETCQRECSDFYVGFKGNCYRAFGITATWIEAKMFCNDLGGDLVSIETQEEQTFLTNALAQLHRAVHPEIYWLDGADFLMEGRWFWMHKHGRYANITSYTYWMPGEPSNHGNVEHCMEFQYGHAFWWNDAPCSNKYNFVCEVPDLSINAIG